MEYFIIMQKKSRMKQGIFDIQTFSLHDGPGIRTTVFLKGCPLRCQWCSNPEGLDSNPTLSYRKSICSGCLNCVECCPTDALTSLDGKLEVKHDACNACGQCMKVCPTGALKLYGHTQSPAEIIDRVKRDREYFEKSGGGLTLSGGEVMMQPGFALEILKLAKKENIHTCIETSGFAGQEDFESILPFVDLFLFDYKLSLPREHWKYTGVSNVAILSNLQYLSEQGAQIVLRVPLIQGINDTEQHFRAISEISRKYDGIQRVEVLPYHNWGEHKYQEIGRQKPGLGSETVSPEMARDWVAKLEVLGCKNVGIS